MVTVGATCNLCVVLQADYGDGRCDMPSELIGFNPRDVDLLMSVQQRHGPHSLPTIAAMFRALCTLNIDALISICQLVPSQLDPATWTRLHGGSNNILPLLLQQLTDVLHTRHRYEMDANNRNLAARYADSGNYIPATDAMQQQPQQQQSDGFRKKPKRRRFEPLTDEPTNESDSVNNTSSLIGDSNGMQGAWTGGLYS